MTTDQPVRVGVIGTGFGARVVAPVYRETPGLDVIDLVTARDGEAPGQIRHGASLKDRGQVQRSPSGDLRQEPQPDEAVSIL